MLSGPKCRCSPAFRPNTGTARAPSDLVLLTDICNVAFRQRTSSLDVTMGPARRTAKAWFGSAPTDLLAHHVGADIRTSGPEYNCRPLSDDPDASWECTGSLSVLGDESPLVGESTDCATEDAARQQAALTMLHEYESRYCRLLQSGRNAV